MHGSTFMRRAQTAPHLANMVILPKETHVTPVSRPAPTYATHYRGDTDSRLARLHRYDILDSDSGQSRQLLERKPNRIGGLQPVRYNLHKMKTSLQPKPPLPTTYTVGLDDTLYALRMKISGCRLADPGRYASSGDAEMHLRATEWSALAFPLHPVVVL